MKTTGYKNFLFLTVNNIKLNNYKMHFVAVESGGERGSGGCGGVRSFLHVTTLFAKT